MKTKLFQSIKNNVKYFYKTMEMLSNIQLCL